MSPELDFILQRLVQQYGQHIQISELNDDYEGGEETWLRDTGANISLKILQMTISEICEENQRLSREKRNNNNSQSLRTKPSTENPQINGVSKLKGVPARLSASELTDVVNNPSQMIEDPASQEDERPSQKKKRFKTVYKSAKEEQKDLRRRENKNRSFTTTPVPVIKENDDIEVILIDNQRGRTPKKNKVLVPETMQFQMTPSLLEREKPRIPDTPEKKGDKAEQVPSRLANIEVRTKQDKVQGVQKVRVVNKVMQAEQVPSRSTHIGERTKQDKVKGVEKARVWEKEEQEEAPSQRIESSSGEPEQGEEERSTSPVFYRSKFGTGNTERLKDISGKRKVKRDLIVPEPEKDLVTSREAKKSSRKSNNSVSNVGTITPIDQHKVDRKTWENLDEDFLSKKGDNPVEADTLCDESPNLMRTSRMVIPPRDDMIPKPCFKQTTEKENTKPKPKPNSKAENRWGLTVDPITESQQKKMKNEKQSTLDMFFNNKDGGGGIKRTKSELEKAILISKAEFETKNKPVAKKAQPIFDDTMELLEQREHRRQMQNTRVPPPLTPPDFWDPCIVEGEPDDPRNVTQQGPPLRSRNDRKKASKLKAQNGIANGDGPISKATTSVTNTTTGGGNSQSRLKRKRTETVNGVKNGNASTKVKAGTSKKEEGSEDEFYF